MEVMETSSDGLKKEFKIVVPAADIETKITDRLSEIAQSARLPGFRPGKVPVKLLRKTYGKAVLGEVIERTVNETTEAAMTERGLRPATQPKIELGEFEDGSDLEYTVAFERFPEIELADLTKIKLERLKAPADEKQVDEMLTRIAEQFKDSKAVEEKRKSKNGDIVVIDFVGTVDGEEFAGGKAEGYGLELGSGTFIPGFEDQVVGASVGDHIDVKVTFPDEYTETLAGKDAVFSVDVKELRETVPSEINDDLAKKVGAENLDDLRKRAREQQEQEYANVSRMRLKRDLLDILDKEHSFELPEEMVEREFEAIWNQFEHQREHHPDQIDEDDKGKSDDELKEQYREIASRRVRLGLLLAEIGRINKIEVTSDELNRALVAEAQKYQGQEKEVLEFYKNNPEAVQHLQSPILEEKVVDFILEMADVSDREVSLDELMKSPEDEKAPAKKAKGGKSSGKASGAKTSKKSDGDKAKKKGA